MGVANGRDTRESYTVVRKGREWKSLATYNATGASNSFPASAFTRAGQRPVRYDNRGLRDIRRNDT